MFKGGMLLDIWQTLQDIVSGFFAIIPQFLYFVFASIASLLDACQLLIRKLVGLDVYYMPDPESGEILTHTGDLLKDFVEGMLGINRNYSALSTVFYSLLIFGVIVLVLCTIFAIIKAHYTYDAKKSHPFAIISQSLKSLALMALTPIILIFGIYISDAFMNALDDITSQPSESGIQDLFEKDAVSSFASHQIKDSNGVLVADAYASYDIFSAKEWSDKTTFSGYIFKIMSSSANRVRRNEYTSTQTVGNENWDNCSIFYADIDDFTLRQEKVANQIDYAFVNNLTLKEKHTVVFDDMQESDEVIGYTLLYGPSAAWNLGLLNVDHFSKFNVGLVWHYYNLWTMNLILGYFAVIACLMLLSNIVFGLMKRLIICLALFLVNAPIIAVTPIDGGNSLKEWRKSFISYFISSYSAIFALNLFILILPIIQGISFFNDSILDDIFNTFIIMAGLVLIKRLVALVSTFVGGANLEDEGGKAKKATGATATKALMSSLATASLGTKLASYAVSGGAAIGGAKGGVRLIKDRIRASEMVSEGTAATRKEALEKIKEDRYNSRLVFKARDKIKGTRMVRAAKAMFTSNTGRALMAYAGIYSGPIFQRRRMIDEDDGETLLDVRETRSRRTKSQLTLMGQRFVEMSEGLLKAVGNATGLDATYKRFKENGVIDEARLTTQNVFQMAGMDDVVKGLKSGDSIKLSTTKQVEEGSRKATLESRKTMEETVMSTKSVTNEIFRLTETFKRRRP